MILSCRERADRCVVAILAGGQGTRLATRWVNVPKPMVPVLEKPVLQYQIELCRNHGYAEIALLVHYRYDVISEYFGNGERFGVRLDYIVEANPRGTAGALLDALPHMAGRFLLLYGDTFMDVDLKRLWNAHASSGAACTLFLHPNDHPQDSDLVELDSNGRVMAIHPYPRTAGRDHRNLVNAALYVVDKAELGQFISKDKKTDLAKDTFPAMLSAGVSLHGYVSPEYIKDMGTPERLDEVERDVECGLPERLSGRHLRSAIFIDRDGTINREVNHLSYPDQVELLYGAAEAIRRINRSGNLAIVVTNQPVLARGDTSSEGMELIHARLESRLGDQGAYLNGIYICPHHPDGGFDGEIVELKCECECRKPLPGMIDQASKDIGIARSTSWMIGDSSADMLAGKRADLRTVLVRTGHAGRDDRFPLMADYVVPDLAAAVDWILIGHNAVCRQLRRVVAAIGPDVRLVLVGGTARAGKSFVAQVLKELVAAFGSTAHVIALDAWLRNTIDRKEGVGVCNRYDMAAANSELLSIVGSRSRIVFNQKIYDRISRTFLDKSVRHSIGAQDLIIVEGVPALLSDELRAASRLRLFVDVTEATRKQRIEVDYKSRGMSANELDSLYTSRVRDEVQVVRESRRFADYFVASDSTA